MHQSSPPNRGLKVIFYFPLTPFPSLKIAISVLIPVISIRLNSINVSMYWYPFISKGINYHQQIEHRMLHLIKILPFPLSFSHLFNPHILLPFIPTHLFSLLKSPLSFWFPSPWPTCSPFTYLYSARIPYSNTSIIPLQWAYKDNFQSPSPPPFPTFKIINSELILIIVLNSKLMYVSIYWSKMQFIMQRLLSPNRCWKVINVDIHFENFENASFSLYFPHLLHILFIPPALPWLSFPTFPLLNLHYKTYITTSYSTIMHHYSWFVIPF